MKSQGILRAISSLKTSTLSKVLTGAFMLTSMTGVVAHAENSPGLMVAADGGLLIELGKTCNREKSCSIEYNRVKVTVSGSEVSGNSYGKIDYLASPVVISNIPLDQVLLCSGSSYYSKPSEDLIIDGNFIKTTGNRQNSYEACNWYSVKKGIYKLQQDTNIPDRLYIRIKAIKLSSSYSQLAENLTLGSNYMYLSYQNSLDQLNAFEGMIKKSDRRHLTRLKSALENTLKAMTDKAGNLVLPVTHQTVTENSRMIMVFATVLNELLDDYGDIEALRNPIETLRNLSKQIRLSYGWSEGLAGSASKSMTALSEVLDLELRDLYASAAAFGQANPQAFNQLMRANLTLNSAARAQNGGDARVKSQVQALADSWNSAEWQAVLVQLLNAPQDYSKLVQPKLKLLIMSMESISDLTGVDITISEQVAKVKTK